MLWNLGAFSIGVVLVKTGIGFLKAACMGKTEWLVAQKYKRENSVRFNYRATDLEKEQEAKKKS